MEDSQNLPIKGDQSKPRESNLDLLRGICAIFVVFEHFCETGAHNAFGFTESSSMTAHMLLRLLYGVARTAVPVFFLLSGYLSVYSKKQKVGKVVNLFFMTIMYSGLTYIARIILSIFNGNANISIKSLLFSFFPQNYYLYLFCVLYAFSPYLNSLLSSLSKKNYQRLIVVLFSVFSLWSTVINTLLSIINDNDKTGVFFTSRTGTSMGFNIANFTMLYIIGGYLRLHYKKSNPKRDVTVSIIVVLSSVLLTSITKVFVPKLSKAFWYYDSSFVIISAVALLIIFLNVKINTHKAITFMGKHTFGTFLIHGFASSCIEKALSIEKVVSKGLGGTLLGILIFVLGTYILALIFTTILEWMAKPLSKWWKKTKVYSIQLMAESAKAE